MNRILFAILISLFVMQISAQAQFKAPSLLIKDRQLSKAETPISRSKYQLEEGDDQILAAHAIESLKRLHNEVLTYRSLGDFEADGRLARVPFEVFKNDLEIVTSEVERLLSSLPPGRLKIEISNTLASYRDGAFWWQRIHQERVVNVSAMSFVETSPAPSDSFFVSTIPYTVAIHWRQAAKYLKHSEELMNGQK